ncbi:hypothetical protein [Novosphingobium cyanobacteriorum]|uniref:Uncharacterized protein n=1 Tax=Novosphingobium cyanobacteriorum TaxID=3024215 RepID=A0ABT6CLM7_9SPHN|nr:hypothetical protein [Novosphingobium cyanobacteriorum]MDF8334825.1 hypothetical protein [Novosphingobium cyanobacteriorum]
MTLIFENITADKVFSGAIVDRQREIDINYRSHFSEPSPSER